MYLKFVFKIYDFDQDGIINKEDVKIILSYIPLNKEKNNKDINTVDFEDRIQSQNELAKILKIAFGKKETLSFMEYISLIEKTNSDIFILLFTFLLEKCPFTKDSIELFMLNENLSEIKSRTPEFLSHMIASPTIDSHFMSSTLKKRTIINKQNNSFLQSIKGNNTEQKISILSLKNDEFKEIEIQNKKFEEENKLNSEKNLEYFGNINTSPNNFIFNKYNESTYDNSSSSPSLEEDMELLFDEDKKPIIKHEGYILKISNEKKIKKIYFKLIGRDLYYFNKKTDKKHAGMHNLSGIYIEEGKKIEIDNKIYYCFNIIFPQKKKGLLFR